MAKVKHGRLSRGWLERRGGGMRKIVTPETGKFDTEIWLVEDVWPPLGLVGTLLHTHTRTATKETSTNHTKSD
jgi:hypothetical protein